MNQSTLIQLTHAHQARLSGRQDDMSVRASLGMTTIDDIQEDQRGSIEAIYCVNPSEFIQMDRFNAIILSLDQGIDSSCGHEPSDTRNTRFICHILNFAIVLWSP